MPNRYSHEAARGDRADGKRGQHDCERPDERVIERHLMQQAPARVNDIEHRQHEHVGERGAEQVADADVDRPEDCGVHIGDQLGKRGARREQHRADPHSSDAGRIRYRIRVFGEP
jgi:hypothetical protein